MTHEFVVGLEVCFLEKKCWLNYSAPHHCITLIWIGYGLIWHVDMSIFIQWIEVTRSHVLLLFGVGRVSLEHKTDGQPGTNPMINQHQI